MLKGKMLSLRDKQAEEDRLYKLEQEKSLKEEKAEEKAEEAKEKELKEKAEEAKEKELDKKLKELEEDVPKESKGRSKKKLKKDK